MNIIVDKKSPEALFIQINKQLKKYVRNNYFKPGDKLPSLKSIADNAKVSLRTAYLGVDLLVEEGICYKRPKNGVFVKDTRITDNIRNICAVYDQRHLNSYMHDGDLVQQTIFKGLSAHGTEYKSEMVFIGNDPIDTINFYQSIENAKLNGVLMLYWNDLKEGIMLAERFPKIKFVYLNYYLKGFEYTPSNVYGVFSDDYGGAYQICMDILQRKHKVVKVFSMDVFNENYKHRIKGFLDGIEEHELAVNTSTVMTSERDNKKSLQAIGAELAEKLYAIEKKVDVIFCVNDLMAEGVVDWLKEHKINNTIVTGYDNIIKHVSSNKKFSTVAIDFDKMGLVGLDIINGCIQKHPKIIKIVPQIIKRT